MVYAGATDSNVIFAAAGVRDRLLSTHLPEEWRLRFARKIYDLLVHYKTGAGTKAVDTPDSVEDETAATKPKTKPRRKTDKPVTKGDLSRRTIAAGEYIFHEGDTGDETCLIKSGEVEISRMSGDRDVPITRSRRAA